MPKILFCTGIFLAALGGLEKIIIFASMSQNVGKETQNIIHSTPSYIWNITNITFVGGVCFILSSLVIHIYTKKK